MSNETDRCFKQRAPFAEPPLIQNGQLTFQAHDIGWIAAGCFTVAATGISFWLISKHLMWYTKKRQQRYIVRLLLMVPIYAIVSLASYIFWNHAIPITLVRDSYESFVLYSFFYLLLQYLSPTSEGQKEVFRNVVLKKWMFPLGFVKYRPVDGLYFLQLMKWGVLQYCIVRPATTLVAVILDFLGLYCDDSWSPGWGHIYITIVVSLSVTVAMYCLLQLYVPIAEQLAPYKPLIKLVSVKAVVFLTFWQATGLSALSTFGVVNDTKYMTADDINTGIAAILETFEMMHKPSNRTPRFLSLIHALDIRDMWKEIREGSVYVGNTIRGVEVEVKTRRRMHFAKVMGREREFSEAKMGTKEGWSITAPYEENFLLDHENYPMTCLRSNGVGAEPSPEVETYTGYLATGKDGVNVGDFEQGHIRGSRLRVGSTYERLSHDEPDGGGVGRPSQSPHRDRLQHRPRVPSLDTPPPSPAACFEYSRDGRSNLKLLLSSKDYSTVIPNHPSEIHVGSHSSQQYQNPLDLEALGGAHKRIYSAARELVVTRRKDIRTFSLLPTSDDPYLELLPPSEKQRGSPTANDDPHQAHAVLGIVRSDSLLARDFTNPITTTVNELVSSKCTADRTPLQHSLSTARYSLHQEYSPSLIRDSQTRVFVHPSPIFVRPVHNVQRQDAPYPQSRSNGRRPRPNIVLPTPLSPARYPAGMSWYSRGGSSSSPIDRNLPRNQQSDLSNPVRLASTSVATASSSGYHGYRKDELVCQDSDHMKLVLSGAFQPLGAMRAPFRDSAPSQNAHADYIYADPRTRLEDAATVTSNSYGALGLERDSRTTPLVTTSPRSPSPHRLRHTRGNIAEAKRPWS